MATITKFEDHQIWQMARDLAKEIYHTCKASYAFQKDYKLREQINAASGSVMDNIAEGLERDGRKGRKAPVVK